jgi:uncharacterized protein YcnI
MKFQSLPRFAVACVLLGAISVANAHVSFVANTAYAGKSYVATANIPHGCEDASANLYDTIRVEMVIPAGFTGVRPADAPNFTASIETDVVTGAVTKLIWTKNTAGLPADTNFIQVTFRGTLPNTPFANLELATTQFCVGDTTRIWSGVDVPKIALLPARAPGWNKYTAQAEIDAATLGAFFKDALIVWSNNAAYSANPITNNLITNKLTLIPAGAEFWVKY